MIKARILHYWNWFGASPKQRSGIRALQIILGLVFIFRSFTEMPFARYLYGNKGISSHVTYDKVYGTFIGEALNRFLQLDFAPHILLFVLAICGICYVVEYKTKVTTLISLIAFNMITSNGMAIADGGDNITQIVLVYMLLISPRYMAYEENSIKVWLHNIGIVAIGAQIMILYFTAGFMKINGDVWTSGIALFNISQVEAFSLPIAREIFKNPYVTTIASYTTMIFLAWFPIAMFSKLKLTWIFIGISFHAGIIGFMGLITFGLTMIGMELFFITDDEYVKMKTSLKRFAENLYRYHWMEEFSSKILINISNIEYKNNTPAIKK